MDPSETDTKGEPRQDRQCAVCHGIDGVAKRPDVPHIGGQSDRLEAFRAGERHHEQMSIIAAALSDQDIADLVAWYASLRFEIRITE